ncbi:MAG: hypothetical protein R3Y52_01435 [Psittacicella sp.]
MSIKDIDIKDFAKLITNNTDTTKNKLYIESKSFDIKNSEKLITAAKFIAEGFKTATELENDGIDYEDLPRMYYEDSNEAEALQNKLMQEMLYEDFEDDDFYEDPEFQEKMAEGYNSWVQENYIPESLRVSSFDLSSNKQMAYKHFESLLNDTKGYNTENFKELQNEISEGLESVEQIKDSEACTM